jgi:hypothetical protein
MTSTLLLKHGRNYVIPIYIPKETILKEVADKIKLSQHFPFDLVQELSDSTVYINVNKIFLKCLTQKHCHSSERKRTRKHHVII